jgi:hypothetical protein
MITYYKQDACLSTSRTVTLLDKHLLECGKTTDTEPLLANLKNDPDLQISLLAFGMCVKFLEDHLLAE